MFLQTHHKTPEICLMILRKLIYKKIFIINEIISTLKESHLILARKCPQLQKVRDNLHNYKENSQLSENNLIITIKLRRKSSQH